MLNLDRNTCQAFKDLKFVWERRTGMEFEGSIMMIPSQAKWSADEERWLRDNCKAFAALKAPAPALSTASAARAAASPAPASANASPATTTRAKAKKTEAANRPRTAAAADAAGTESDDVEQRDARAGRASSAGGAGTGRGRGRASQVEGCWAPAARRLLGSSRTKPCPSSGRHRDNGATRSAA